MILENVVSHFFFDQFYPLFVRPIGCTTSVDIRESFEKAGVSFGIAGKSVLGYVRRTCATVGQCRTLTWKTYLLASSLRIEHAGPSVFMLDV
jgi:hypothetical protein